MSEDDTRQWQQPGAGRYGRYEVRGVLGSGGMGIVLEGYDPELARPVAIKVLHAEHAASEYLIREARAMARLAHPNVVQVFEAGRANDRVFLAMELVRGETLRGWLTAKRSAREIVAMFVAAGRGLAAAHAAGLVHRDFKPDNVLIGADGRPRVGDFGLVIDSQDGDGARAGTPAYMSPEQWDGRAVGPASDQFAFCVALWEALSGARPFGELGTGAAAKRGVVAGRLRTAELREATRGGALVGRLPRRLDAALRRGLAAKPAARWPTLTALLDALERRRPRWPLIAVPAAAITAIALLVRPGPAVCPPPDARVASVWGVARRAALGPALGAQRAQVTRQLDAHVAHWRAMYGEACRATRVARAQPDAVLDARMRCLDHRWSELDATLQLVTTAANAEQRDHAIGAVFQLTPIDRCGDARRPGDLAPLPPGRRAALEALEHQLQLAEIDRRAERLTGLPARAEAAVATARALEHPPALGTALDLLADVQIAVNLHAEAERTLRELIRVAAGTHDDRTEARAWTRLIYVLGYARGQPAEALALAPSATAALARAGDPLDLRVRLEISLAQAQDAGPDVAAAIARLERVKQALAEDAARATRTPGLAGPPTDLAPRLRLDVLAELGNAYNVAGDLAAEIAALQEALTGYRALLGPDSLDEAMVLTNLGDALRRNGKPAEAMLWLREAARITEAKTGASQRLALIVEQLAYALGEQDQWPAALGAFEHALAIARAQLPAGDAALAPYFAGLASALGHVDRADEARHAYDAAAALFEDGDINLPIALVNRGDLELEHGHLAEALAAYTRAAARFEALRGGTSSYLLYPLVGLGRVHVLGGRLADARRVLERAVDIEPDGGDRSMAAAARAWLGHATPDRARGRQLLHEGREALRALAASDANALHELDLLARVR